MKQQSQKLFQIDDKTVCTIAGFGGIPLPKFPEFTNTAAGILDEFVEQERDNPETFDQKLHALGWLFAFYLQGIANMTVERIPAEKFASWFILAGYDNDGTARMAKVRLDTILFPAGNFETAYTLEHLQIVGEKLVHETAGIGGPVAENILSYPAQFSEEKAINRYGMARSKDGASSLTLPEMAALASSLAHHGSTVYPNLIGGDDQVATLEKGKKAEVTAPFFPTRKIKKFGFQTYEHINIGGPMVIMQRPFGAGIFIDLRILCNDFDHDVWLDGNFFFGVEFVGCTLHYNGYMMEFDPSSKVTYGTLRFGSRVDRSLPWVRTLESKFAPWAVYCCEVSPWKVDFSGPTPSVFTNDEPAPGRSF